MARLASRVGTGQEMGDYLNEWSVCSSLFCGRGNALFKKKKKKGVERVSWNIALNFFSCALEAELKRILG